MSSLLLGLMPASLGNVTFINNFLVSLGVLVSILPQALQNGGGQLGLLPSPVLPPFLGGPGGNNAGFPWGNRTANNTNYYVETPDTGVTRHYDLTIARKAVYPDGIKKEAILINGQFPGPLIQANWGDYIEVTVHNAIAGPEEGTGLHWHGLTQKKTPYYDGVPSVQMCPIAPGKSFTYRFQADLYGTGWYHSHYSAQYAGGIYGPMVIYGPSSAPYDLDVGPIIFSDLFHSDYTTYINNAASKNVITAQLNTAENTVIQGKGIADCSGVGPSTKCTPNAGLAKFNVTSGKIHRLRLINTSAAAFMIISLDDHDMTVIANDYVPVSPYTVKQVYLHVGQRTDVLVRATGAPGGAYWLRARQPTLCALAFQPFALAAVYYEGANTNAKPRSLPHPDFIMPSLIHCANDPLSYSYPYYEIAAAAEPDTTVTVQITQTVNSTGNSVYLMNGQTFRANYNLPLLQQAFDGNYSFKPEWNVYNFGRNETIRIIFQNNVPFSHPMHVHGQNMQILDEGVGSWDGKTIINPQNPQRRDTQTLQPNGYLVVQLTADNPGVWPFHCHIAWHVSAGLYINILQKGDEVKNKPETPSIIAESCQDWNAFASKNVVVQPDSGLKMAMEKDKRVDPNH